MSISTVAHDPSSPSGHLFDRQGALFDISKHDQGCCRHVANPLARAYDPANPGENTMTRQALLIVGFLVAAYPLHPSVAQQQKVGAPPESSNMRLVGWTDLQARSAYQPTIQKQGDRYIAYIGHHGGTPEVPKPLNPHVRCVQ